MRLILKLLLFPIILVLALCVAVGRFLCLFSSVILLILSGLLFFFGVLCLLLLSPIPALCVWAIAFLISPFGIPAIASWLVNRLDDLRHLLSSV